MSTEQLTHLRKILAYSRTRVQEIGKNADERFIKTRMAKHLKIITTLKEAIRPLSCSERLTNDSDVQAGLTDILSSYGIDGTQYSFTVIATKKESQDNG